MRSWELERVVRTREGLIVNASEGLEPWRAHPLRRASAAAGLKSMLAVPLQSGADVIGTMNLKSRRMAAYGLADLALAGRVSAQVSTVIANSRLYEQAPQLAEERQLSQLQIMKRNGRQLNTLINDLLDISKIDGGTMRLDLTDFDARELMR